MSARISDADTCLPPANLHPLRWNDQIDSPEGLSAQTYKECGGSRSSTTTVIEERGGYLIKPLQDVFPDQKPIATGTDVAVIEGGRIRSIHVFVDPPS